MKMHIANIDKNDYGIIIKNFTNRNNTYIHSIFPIANATTHQFEQVFF